MKKVVFKGSAIRVGKENIGYSELRRLVREHRVCGLLYDSETNEMWLDRPEWNYLKRITNKKREWTELDGLLYVLNEPLPSPMKKLGNLPVNRNFNHTWVA